MPVAMSARAAKPPTAAPAMVPVEVFFLGLGVGEEEPPAPELVEEEEACARIWALPGVVRVKSAPATTSLRPGTSFLLREETSLQTVSACSKIQEKYVEVVEDRTYPVVA